MRACRGRGAIPASCRCPQYAVLTSGYSSVNAARITSIASSVTVASAREVEAQQLELSLEVPDADAEDGAPTEISSRVMNDFAVCNGWR